MEEKELHYDKFAGHREGRTSISAMSKRIEAEENGGVDKYFFKSRFIDDNQHTLNYFIRVAKRFGGVKGQELKRMKEMVTSSKDEEYLQQSGKKYFDDEVLYEALISNPVAKKVCEKNGYNSWVDISTRIN